MSITSAQGYEMQLSRRCDRIDDPPEPYWQTVERLLADRGVDRKAKRKNRGPGLDRLPIPWNAAVRELLRKLRRMLGT